MIGLPSLQALDGAPGPRIWLAAEATDMRCGFDRLAQRVQAVIGADPLSGHLFLFRSRSGNRFRNVAIHRVQIADRQVLSKIRGLFGGRLRL